MKLMSTNFANTEDIQYQTHSHLLDALYYYEKLVTFCGNEINSGLNKLYQIQSAGIPGNIAQAIDNKMWSQDPKLGTNLPGVHILRAVNYADNLINLNLCSWIRLFSLAFSQQAPRNTSKTATRPFQPTPFNEFLYNLLGGIQLYMQFNVDTNVCEKLEDLAEAIFDIKRKQNIPFDWHYNNVRTILQYAVSQIDHQFAYISTVGGRLPKPEETNEGTFQSFLKAIPLALSVFRNNRDILLLFFRLMYVAGRLRSGAVIEPKKHTLLSVSKKIANMRISDTTVACIPLPIAQILPSFEEEESSRIGRYALYYVDRLTLFLTPTMD